jgi:hypothetical protein
LWRNIYNPEKVATTLSIWIEYLGKSMHDENIDAIIEKKVIQIFIGFIYWIMRR